MNNLFNDLLGGLPAVTQSPSLPEKELQSLIQDIVLRTSSEEEILKVYNITPQQFQLLQQTPTYQEQLKKISDYIRALGPNASFVLKARAIAESQMGVIGTVISDMKVDPAVRLQAMKEFVKWGGLFNEKEPSAAGGGGVNISFNFGKLGPPISIKDVN